LLVSCFLIARTSKTPDGRVRGLCVSAGACRTIAVAKPRAVSASPPKADIDRGRHAVRFVPIADMGPYSITSSARESTDDGTVRPSPLAVFRLITSSFLVGACTGRSAGFSPLRMRST